jgi:hypothetical protein
MSRARDTRPDGLRHRIRRVDGERGTDPEFPPPGSGEVISEDLVAETLKALEEAANKGVVFTPKTGVSIPDTSAVDTEDRHALAYWSGGRRSPQPGHRTLPPAETMIVSRTPVDGPQRKHPSEPLPEVVEHANPSLGELLDSVGSDPAVPQRDIPTLVPPGKKLLALLRDPVAVPIAVFVAVIVAGTFLIVFSVRRQTVDLGRAAERLEAPAMSQSGSGSTAGPSSQAFKTARGTESASAVPADTTSAVAATSATASSAPPVPIAVVPRAPAVEHPSASRQGPKRVAAPARSSGPPAPKPSGEKNIMVDEL